MRRKSRTVTRCLPKRRASMPTVLTSRPRAPARSAAMLFGLEHDGDGGAVGPAWPRAGAARSRGRGPRGDRGPRGRRARWPCLRSRRRRGIRREPQMRSASRAGRRPPIRMRARRTREREHLRRAVQDEALVDRAHSRQDRERVGRVRPGVREQLGAGRREPRVGRLRLGRIRMPPSLEHDDASRLHPVRTRRGR